VVHFMTSGLEDEVRRLQAGPRPLSRVAAQAIGYAEVIAMLAGQATRSQTVERIQARTRQFAKRQVTWFRGLTEVRSINVAPDEGPDTVADRLALTIRDRVIEPDSLSG
jgi:tRNA dimethylallyltransferase